MASSTSSAVVPSGLVQERVANYALNRTNLLQGLTKDAYSDKADVSCEVKSFGENVNLQCNSGFFLAVAKPALSSFQAGSTMVVQGITCTMPDKPTLKKDTTGLYETLLLQFNLKTATIPACVLGRAAVHLHLTTRLIQIQGGQRMPDSTPIAIWFTDNVVLPLLRDQANTAKVDRSTIDSINTAILSANASSQNSHQRKQFTGQSSGVCGKCEKGFDSRASIVPCPACKRFFHKTHFKTHTCVVPSLTCEYTPPPPPQSHCTTPAITLSTLQSGPHQSHSTTPAITLSSTPAITPTCVQGLLKNDNTA